MQPNQRTLIIAEAGVNHNGDMALARQLIDVAAEAGVDYVKFQTFKTEALVSPLAQKADYQKKSTGAPDESQFAMIKKLELDVDAHHTLIAHAAAKGVKFFSTAFDLTSVDLLDDLGLEIFKIPSGEITNLPYLRKIAGKRKPTLLSTGMSNLSDIEAALEVLLSNGLERSQITVLHCNTQYPTPIEDVNLRAMDTIAAAFNVAVGYSDHTLGITVPIAAVARGAVCIEKHFTLDRTLPGPDHGASLEPEELKRMVAGIRAVEAALGSPIKQASASERGNLAVARKSVFVARPVAKGQQLVAGDLTTLRPGDGISPMRLDELIGTTARRDLQPGEQLSIHDVG